ncbi:hypothetical protein G6F37_004057 [Rhizopus arrhizus]|nr:hypothetical protein G6F38_004197 [Rhizopus arrhizus]KAG1160368.1 hypothetical protein G6F37_004057 [Rhizopus arrhizus]
MSAIKGLLIDLSGTIHIDSKVIPGAIQAIERLKASNIPFRFATNTTKVSSRQLVNKLNKLGFQIEEKDVFTSLSACRDMIQSKQLRPLLLMETEAEEEFEGIDRNQPNSVVIGLAPSKFNYEKLNEAFRLITNNPDIPLIAVHKAKYFADKDEQLSMGPGGFVQALEYATGKEATIAGKPTRQFFEMALQQINMLDTPENVAIIGDDVHNDLGGGAKELGLQRYLVQTGKYRKEDENKDEDIKNRQRLSSSFGPSRNNNNDISAELKVGARAQTQGKVGTIRFVGTTSFQTGKWVGIELDEPQGKNSGVVQGKRYFDCRLNHGVFVRPSQVKVIEDQATVESPTPTVSSSRFAPARDPNLAAATSKTSTSTSTTLLPSRISRLPQNNAISGLRRPTVAGLASNNKKSISPPISREKRSSTLSQFKSETSSPSSSPTASRSSFSFAQHQAEEIKSKHRSDDSRLSREIRVNQRKSPEVEREEEPEEGPEEEPQRDRSQEELEKPQERIHSTPEPKEITVEQEVIKTSSTGLKNNTQPTYGSLAANLPVSKSEQMVPLKDYEELRLKLKILETKRQEDRERYREHEKVKEEAEQFLTLRNKLQDKISDLQRELRETKRELKESVTEQEAYESKYNDAIESLEMMTLDKEVAEEKAENLQQEVNVLKDKIEEISVDLDVLKKEADIMNRVPERDGEEKTPLEVIQLERHNERLKEALMRLRDATMARENELCDKIKELEKETHELEELKTQFNKTRERLRLAELTIEELKQSLDDALGAEDLVEQLTEKNLALTEKMEEMHLVVEDLEALKELADELEDNHIETEKQLQAEIDHRDMLLREQMERMRAAEETNADYETTIQQFRELVTMLQNDLEHLRHKEVSQQSEQRTLSSQSQAMMSLNIQLQSTVMKAQAKSIDLELRKLEAAQANDRLSYIQPYLPDSFFKTENDAISCVLLFKRLVFKSELVIKQLDQNHPISEKIMDTVPESLISVCEMRQRAGWLSDLSKRFVTFIVNCSPMTFIKMGQVYHDLVGTERRLTNIVDLLRTDEVNEAECVTELQRMIAQLEHLSEIHLIQNEENNVDQFFGLTRALDLNADRLTVELTFVRQALDNAARKENITIIEGLNKLDFDYLEPLGRLIVQAKNSKILAKKLLRQLEDLSEQALTLTFDYLHRFKMLYAISSKICKFCYETYKQIAKYTETKVGSKEDISLEAIRQIVYNKADEILEIPESTMWEGCLKTLKSLTNELGSTFESISNETKTQKITIGVSPWIQRASDMKAEIVINHDMERKLQQHSDEILKLIKDVKLKDQSLQEANVKIELLEKRMEIVKKQTEQIQTLEESLSKSQQQQQEYSQEAEKLKAEYEGLKEEHAQLQKEVAQKEEKRLSATKKAEMFLEDTSLLSLDNEDKNIDVYILSNQLESLKSAIRYLRAENAYLKETDMLKSLNLDYYHSRQVPSTPPLTDDDTSDDDDEQVDQVAAKSMVRSVVQETRTLIKDARIASATAKVIQLSPERRGGKWQSDKKLPDYRYQMQQSVLYTLKRRCEVLKEKMKQIQTNERYTKGNQNTLLVDKKKLNNALAKVQIPSNINNTEKKLVQLESFKEFEKIHNMFIR